MMISVIWLIDTWAYHEATVNPFCPACPVENSLVEVVLTAGHPDPLFNCGGVHALNTDILVEQVGNNDLVRTASSFQAEAERNI